MLPLNIAPLALLRDGRLSDDKPNFLRGWHIREILHVSHHLLHNVLLHILKCFNAVPHQGSLNVVPRIFISSGDSPTAQALWAPNLLDQREVTAQVVLQIETGCRGSGISDLYGCLLWRHFVVGGGTGW
jgi:hypothetical protein